MSKCKTLKSTKNSYKIGVYDDEDKLEAIALCSINGNGIRQNYEKSIQIIDGDEEKDYEKIVEEYVKSDPELLKIQQNVENISDSILEYTPMNKMYNSFLDLLNGISYQRPMELNYRERTKPMIKDKNLTEDDIISNLTSQLKKYTSIIEINEAEIKELEAEIAKIKEKREKVEKMLQKLNVSDNQPKTD